jgi:hypothetical protein
MPRMTTALHPDPIADLWRQARSWLADAVHDFSPVEVAKALAHSARTAIRRRLALIEALLMKLLLIEAARHPGRTARLQARITASAGQCAPGGARSNPAPAEDPTDPSTWRVRFHLRVPQRRRAAPLQSRLVDRLCPKPGSEAVRAQAKARKLARRFEALRRVIADPRRAITRLACKLAALGARAYEAARRIALAQAPRSKHEGKTFAAALIHAHDSSFVFRHDTS